MPILKQFILEVFLIALATGAVVGECPLYTYVAPKDGALACSTIGGSLVCAVMCKNGFDFVFDPPLWYFCDGDSVSFWANANQPYKVTFPGPDCSAQAGTSWLKSTSYLSQYYFFPGDDANVEDVIKTNFVDLMKDILTCPADMCNKDNTTVSMGVASGECPLYDAPKNGALACVTVRGSRYCAAMCKRGFDFVFNPPLFYWCSSGQWTPYTISGLDQQFDDQLPWPDCSDQMGSTSWLKQSDVFRPYFFFRGDSANVEDVIKTKFIDLMTNTGYVPPFFCFDECNKDATQVFMGADTV